MRRTDLMDTSETSYRKLLERLRSMTPEEKGRMLSERIEGVREMRKHTSYLREKPKL